MGPAGDDVVAVVIAGGGVPDSIRVAAVRHGAVGHWAAHAEGTALARPAAAVGAWVRPGCGAAEALQRVGEAHTVQIAPRCVQVTGANPLRTNVPMLSKADASARHGGDQGSSQRSERSEWIEPQRAERAASKRK